MRASTPTSFKVTCYIGGKPVPEEELKNYVIVWNEDMTRVVGKYKKEKKKEK